MNVNDIKLDTWYKEKISGELVYAVEFKHDVRFRNGYFTFVYYKTIFHSDPAKREVMRLCEINRFARNAELLGPEVEFDMLDWVKV